MSCTRPPYQGLTSDFLYGLLPSTQNSSGLPLFPTVQSNQHTQETRLSMLGSEAAVSWGRGRRGCGSVAQREETPAAKVSRPGAARPLHRPSPKTLDSRFRSGRDCPLGRDVLWGVAALGEPVY